MVEEKAGRHIKSCSVRTWVFRPGLLASGPSFPQTGTWQGVWAVEMESVLRVSLEWLRAFLSLALGVSCRAVF